MTYPEARDDADVQQAFHTPLASPPLQPVKWEKILWRKQPFPDNFVPTSFLSELKDLRPSRLPSVYQADGALAAPRPRPRLRALISAALPVSQHLAVIAIVLAVFHGLLVGTLGAGEVGWGCFSLGLAGYAVRRLGWGPAALPHKGLGAPHLCFSDEAELDRGPGFVPPPTPMRPLILPPLLLSLLSPVLGTLTSATTDDTIWPLAGALFFVHLLLADFTTGPDRRQRRAQRRRQRRGSVIRKEDLGEEKSLTSSLSLTSALSASVVLASRLPSTAHVFSLVLLAVGLFAGWPSIAKGVREAGRSFSLGLTVSMIALAVSLLSSSSLPLESSTSRLSPPLVAFLSILALVNLVGPVMLWWGWRWKTRRGGGWDIAVVKLRPRSGQG